jgi:16S rRNA (guanine1207-N2)-methyltransferase
LLFRKHRYTGAMSRDALKTLFHPFETGDVEVPTPASTILFLGAEPGFLLPESFPRTLRAVQGFRPDFLRLKASGYDAAPRLLSDRSFDLTLVLCGRHRGQNELRIAAAFRATSPGGLIVVAGSKDEGAASLKKRLEALTAIAGSTPKYHGLAFWFHRPADAVVVEAILRSENTGLTVEGRFATAPGMFSHDRIDPGSHMLAEHLPDNLSGKIADFCAGWGYLAANVAERCPSARSIDLYEADFESLEAAKQNLGGVSPETKFFWHDLLSEPVGERYDAIVMNPPFHAGRAAEPDIGQGTIAVAAKALKKGGRLFMVANRRLPYENSLAAAFADVSEIAGDQAFKVLMARR